MLLYLGGPIDLSQNKGSRTNLKENLSQGCAISVYDPSSAFSISPTLPLTYKGNLQVIDSLRTINNRAMFLADIVLFVLPSNCLSIGSVTELVDYTRDRQVQNLTSLPAGFAPRDELQTYPTLIVYLPDVDIAGDVPTYLSSLLKVGSPSAVPNDYIMYGKAKSGDAGVAGTVYNLSTKNNPPIYGQRSVVQKGLSVIKAQPNDEGTDEDTEGGKA